MTRRLIRPGMSGHSVTIGSCGTCKGILRGLHPARIMTGPGSLGAVLSSITTRSIPRSR